MSRDAVVPLVSHFFHSCNFSRGPFPLPFRLSSVFAFPAAIDSPSAKLANPQRQTIPYNWLVPMRPTGSRTRSSRLAGRDLLEGLAGVGENSGNPCFRLIASDNDIDVEGIELDAAAQPPGILGRDESQSGAEEGIENNLATVCQVDQRILEHGGRFHSRMIL